MHARTQRFDLSAVPQWGPTRRPPAAKAGDAGGADLYFASDIVWISTAARPTGPVASL
jgi:hypothetical protein